MTFRKIMTIARYTVLEALHTRLLGLVVLLVLLAFCASLFVRAIAVTESLRLQIAFLAAGTRLVGVFVVSLYVIGSINREFNDKGLELLLSLDLPRAGFVLGKLLGYSAIALLIALLACLPLAASAPLAALALWGLSLSFELLLIAAASLFAIVSFGHIVPALSFVAAFYLLARSITAILLISGSALLEASPAYAFMALLVKGISLLLPGLDQFTQAAWLVNADAEVRLLPLAAQTLVYTALLLTATLYDFYRKDL